MTQTASTAETVLDRLEQVNPAPVETEAVKRGIKLRIDIDKHNAALARWTSRRDRLVAARHRLEDWRRWTSTPAGAIRHRVRLVRHRQWALAMQLARLLEQRGELLRRTEAHLRSLMERKQVAHITINNKPDSFDFTEHYRRFVEGELSIVMNAIDDLRRERELATAVQQEAFRELLR